MDTKGQAILKLVSFSYARVSTKEQSLDRQRTDLSGYKFVPECNRFEDVHTGKDFSGREEYQKMKSVIEYQLQVIGKDTMIEVIVKELDRLGRNKDLIKKELEWFKLHGVIVRILDIPTTLIEISEENKWVVDMVNNILIEVYSTIAQQEVDHRAQRQREGTEEAKKRGVKFGRPPVEYNVDKFKALYVKWKSNEITATAMMKELCLTPNTFYRRVKDYENQEDN